MFYGEKNGPKVVFDHVWFHHNTDIVTEKSNHSFLSWHQNEKKHYNYTFHAITQCRYHWTNISTSLFRRTYHSAIINIE